MVTSKTYRQLPWVCASSFYIGKGYPAIWLFRSFLPSAEIMNAWICISVPPYIFKTWFLVKDRKYYVQIPVAAGSAATTFLWLWGSNPASSMDACLLSVLRYHAEVSASGWSLVQRSSIEGSLSKCDRVAPQGDAMTRNRVEVPYKKKG